MLGTGKQGWAEFFSPPRRSTNSVWQRSVRQPGKTWTLAALRFSQTGFSSRDHLS
jgi:hypothetical protein